MDHRNQHACVAGKLPPYRPSHDLRHGGPQAAHEGVHDEPGRTRGHVLVHSLPVHPGLHYSAHHHQHLLLSHPLPRVQLHPPRQAEAVGVGEEGHQDGADGHRLVPDLLVTLPRHPGDQPEQQPAHHRLCLRLQHQHLPQLLAQLHQPANAAHLCPELPRAPLPAERPVQLAALVQGHRGQNRRLQHDKRPELQSHRHLVRMMSACICSLTKKMYSFFIL